MMHAGRYSIPATSKGKRFHPLAIKARGCTALKKGKRGEKGGGTGHQRKNGRRGISVGGTGGEEQQEERSSVGGTALPHCHLRLSRRAATVNQRE